MNRIIDKTLVFIVLCVSAFTLFTHAHAYAQTSFDCTTVTEIPTIECEALVVFYNSTNGDNWNYDNGVGFGEPWLESTTPCEWYGVACGQNSGDRFVRQIYLSGSTGGPSLGLNGTLPEEIGNLSNLDRLSLARSGLTNIPAEIGNLTKLQILDLSGGQISTIPLEIGNLTELTNLDLSINQIITIPTEIENLTDLTELNLSNNQITAIPAEIATLTNLGRLYLSGNQLTTIPDFVWELDNLWDLDLSGNYLVTISENIGTLTNLSKLNLSSTGLITIPTEIGDLVRLNELNLNRNKFPTIPNEIGNLTSLSKLYLNSNQLIGLPDEIGDLINLVELDIGYNQIVDWPSMVSNLNLRKLLMPALCEPNDLQVWLDTILVWQRSRVLCSDVGIDGRLWIEYDGVDGFTEGDEPLVGEQVQISGMIGWVLSTTILTTNDEGIYQITPLPFAQYTITTNANGPVLYTLAQTNTVHTLSQETPRITQNFVGVSGIDYSDAPLSYGSASHIIRTGLYLGDGVEGDPAVQPVWSDIGSDDDDGIVGATLTVTSGEQIILPIDVVNETVDDADDAYIYAAIDLNGDGIFGSDELVESAPIPSPFRGTVPLNLGESTAEPNSDIVLRLRLTTDQNISPFGLAPDGEAEDYLIHIAPLPITPEPTPQPDGDIFEIDDTCASASQIETSGIAQTHAFHDANDVDWVRFEVEEGVNYQLLGQGESGSPVDLVVELYPACDEAYEEEQSHSFAPGVRLGFTASTNGTYYAKLYNQQGAVYGDDVTYTLSIQAETEESPQGMAIIVAGRQGEDDPLQSNIHFVTNEVYSLFAERDYPDSRIHYLATDLDLDPFEDGTKVVDGTPSLANLTEVISNNINQLGDGTPLTLYMMSHGLRDELFLDGENGEAITPADLDALLTWVEDTVPGVIINVVIDACYSGSFIATDDEFGQTLSKSGRVIVTSASEWKLAWASRRGSRFSDFFINALRLEYSVAEAFQIARNSTRAVRWTQNPQLDDNGNGVGNDLGDGSVASERGFSFGNFSVDGEPSNWVPYIAQVEPAVVTNTQATVNVQVLDDKGNDTVWAVLVPPFHVDPTADNTASSGDLIQDSLLTIELAHTSGGYYSGTFPALSEVGEYEVIFYAEDKEGGLARPVSTTFVNDTTVVNEPEVEVPLAVGTTTAITTSPLTVLALSIIGCTLWAVTAVCEKRLRAR